MTAPVRRPSVPSAVGENRKRIRILEATPNMGCYVFLDETVSVAGDREMSVTGIDQTYRHLVIEIMVGALLGLGTQPDDQPHIYVDFGSDYMYAPAIVYADPVDPTSPTATLSTNETIPVVMPNSMTLSDATSDDGPGYISHATLKLPYYTEDYYSTGGLWSATGYGKLTVPGDTDTGGTFSVGGFVNSPADAYGGPITEVNVSCSEREFLVNQGVYNAGTVYVAGDYVTYLGNGYISIAGSTGVAPVPPDGGASWVSYYYDLAEGSKVSVYGVC